MYTLIYANGDTGAPKKSYMEATKFETLEEAEAELKKSVAYHNVHLDKVEVGMMYYYCSGWESDLYMIIDDSAKETQSGWGTKTYCKGDLMWMGEEQEGNNNE